MYNPFPLYRAGEAEERSFHFLWAETVPLLEKRPALWHNNRKAFRAHAGAGPKAGVRGRNLKIGARGMCGRRRGVRTNMNVYEQLYAARDDANREFVAKLVPNIPKESILGVRTPAMRAIAKEVFRSGEKDAFLASLPHRCLEENLVHFFVIAEIRDFAECVAAVEAFLPRVDCWPVSDQATPKSFRKNREKLLPYIRKWIASPHVYTARFGLRMLMNEFLSEDFSEEYLALAASPEGEDYYLKMMQAWYFATALAKQYDATLPYMEKGKLDEWVRRKAIQKAVESFRVTEEHKAYLKSLR